MSNRRKPRVTHEESAAALERWEDSIHTRMIGGDDRCGEVFYAWDSQWSVPRWCHRPTGHNGGHCATSWVGHIHSCTDAVEETKT